MVDELVNPNGTALTSAEKREKINIEFLSFYAILFL
jgi:hypothetical protein